MQDVPRDVKIAGLAPALPQEAAEDLQIALLKHIPEAEAAVNPAEPVPTVSARQDARAAVLAYALQPAVAEDLPSVQAAQKRLISAAEAVAALMPDALLDAALADPVFARPLVTAADQAIAHQAAVVAVVAVVVAE